MSDETTTNKAAVLQWLNANANDPEVQALVQANTVPNNNNASSVVSSRAPSPFLGNGTAIQGFPIGTITEGAVVPIPKPNLAQLVDVVRELIKAADASAAAACTALNDNNKEKLEAITESNNDKANLSEKKKQKRIADTAAIEAQSLVTIAETKAKFSSNKAERLRSKESKLFDNYTAAEDHQQLLVKMLKFCNESNGRGDDAFSTASIDQLRWVCMIKFGGNVDWPVEYIEDIQGLKRFEMADLVKLYVEGGITGNETNSFSVDPTYGHNTSHAELLATLTELLALTNKPEAVNARKRRRLA